MEKNTTIALVGMLLSLMIPTNLNLYGQEEYNQSLAYRYGNTTDKLKIEMKQLFDECIEFINISTKDVVFGEVQISFQDKCKVVIKHYEDLGWYVINIGESYFDRESKYDTISFVFGFTSLGCVNEKFEEHVLLQDREDCQKAIQYYLANGYDLVDKYDEKVELIKGQAPSALNSSQLDPR